jgi:hypothetical protein
VTRPKLREIPLETAWPLRPGELTVTMGIGQWDRLLANMYEAGAVLLEVDKSERPLRAYQRASS